MVIDCVTSNITFPAGVVDCINYSFNCCDTIVTIYAWFTVNAVFHLTDCYVVFNLTICINRSRCVVTVNEVQALRQFNGLRVSAVSGVFQYCIAKSYVIRINSVNCMTVITVSCVYSYIITSLNFCFSCLQLFYVNCISIIYTSIYVNNCFITSIDTSLSNGWATRDSQAIVINYSIANC